MQVREWLALLVGVSAVSWAAPLIRLAEAPALTVAALRLTFAAIPFLVVTVLLRRGELRSLGRGDLGVIALAGLCIGAHFGFWVASVQDTSLVASTAIVATQPLFAGVGGWLLLGERLTRALMVGIAISTAGALMLAGEDFGEATSLRGDFYALLGAAFVAGYFLAGRRARAKLSNVSYAALVNSIGACSLLVTLTLAGGSVTGHPSDAYMFIVLLALVPQLIGHGSLTWALGSLPAVMVTVAALGEPVGAALIGATLLDEPPTLLELVGAAVLLSGVYVALRGGPGVPLGSATGHRSEGTR